ncbi:IclR family transcriptional regulator [uncultured Pseudoalteromonas sp.]|uniref:IclR family transcriptional regulator n=1 Tax=uncultured Pseudoalteromonas sp. TaxID=114053 RepID=UPI00259ABC21|nr:IclR family transcriptional regulator [uncultured Pseudoalteromonas sp.]
MTNPLKRIQSVERAFILLEAIAVLGGRARLNQLTEHCKLNKTTAHGLLNTLVSLGYVERDEGCYTLGARLPVLSAQVDAQHQLIRTRFQSILVYAANLSGETSYLAVLGGNQDYIYAEAIQSGKSLRLANPRGRREKLETSAIGKVFIAFNDGLVRQLLISKDIASTLTNELKLIRERGYAFDLEDAEIGLNCLAIPLYHEGKIEAVLGVAGPAARIPESQLRTFADNLQRISL